MRYLIIRNGKSHLCASVDEHNSFQNEGIEVYYRKGVCYLSCKSGYVLEDGVKICRLAERRYHIESLDGFHSFDLYVYSDDTGAENYGFYQNRDLKISHLDDADIITADPYLQNGSFYLRDGRIDSDLDFSVNERTYEGGRVRQGDRIRILGLCIYYYTDFLYINSFRVRNRLPSYAVKPVCVRYLPMKKENRFCPARQRKGLIIPELKKYEPYEKKQSVDLWRSILPSLIMSLSVFLISALGLHRSISQGKGFTDSLAYVISPIAMFLAGVVLPICFHHSEKRREEDAYEKRVTEYLAYLDAYEEDLKGRIDAYVSESRDLYFSLKDLHKDPFYLKKEEEDYLCLSLGFYRQSFAFPYDPLEKRIDKRLEKIAHLLSEVGPLPFLLDLKEDRYISFLCKKSEKVHFFLRFLFELAYKHSYEDLSIAVYDDDLSAIGAFYDLPHMYSDGQRLYFDEQRSLQELDLRKLDKPLYLFTKHKIDLKFLNEKIFVLQFCDDERKISRHSKTIVDLTKTNGILYGEDRKSFSYTLEDYDILTRFHELGMHNRSFLPKKQVSFSGLFKDFDIRKSYLESHKKLRADFALSDDHVLYFDLHQSALGPHGLIGGATGSGKSELIISLLLSLCIRYSPDYLQIALIDYKGSGILDSLSHEGRALKHIVASLSNLEGNDPERFIIALKNLCRYRQSVFARISKKALVSISDLDDYLSLGPKNYGFETMAHLLIVADEFAELKKENPQLIRELISIARIGRSLGIHLLLATQKPGGCIDEEIWSNSHFKICLKVLEEKDSQDIIHSKDGAYLRKAGEFLLKTDALVSKCQAIYAKNDVDGNSPYEVGIYRNDLQDDKKISRSAGDSEKECACFIKKFHAVCKELNLSARMLDFRPPEAMERRKLAKGKCIVLGEIDDYLGDKRGLLAYSLKEDVLICSSRRNEVFSLCNTLNENKRDFLFIGRKTISYGYCAGSYLYEETEEILKVFSLLEKTDRELTVVIEDLNVFLNYDEQHFYKLTDILKRKGTNISFICLSSSTLLPFRLLDHFKNRSLIACRDSNDIPAFFGMKSAYKGDSFFMKQEPMSFVPILIEEEIKEEVRTLPFLKRLPEIAVPERKGDSYLIGYDVRSREKIFLSGKLYVSCEEDGLSRIYQTAYEEVEVIDKESFRKMKEPFLWIGPGIRYQRSFSVDLKTDLKENEGLLFNEGKKICVRCIDEP